MKKMRGPFVVWLIAAALMPAVASAQEAGGGAQSPDLRRPYRGIFNGLSTPRTPQSLTLSASILGAYDDNVLEDVSNQASRDWWLQESGFYAGATASLDYLLNRDGQRVDYGINAGATAAYYLNEDFDSFAPTFHAGFDMGVDLTRSTRLALGHQFAYAYSYQFYYVLPFEPQVVADGLIVSDPALDVLNLPSLRNDSRVGVSQKIGKYASAMVGYDLRMVHFLDEEVPDEDDENLQEGQIRSYTTQSVTARIQYDKPLSAHATLNLGYGIRVSDSREGSGQSRAVHDVRAGVTYSRALSFSRRTSFSFATGSAAAVSDELNESQSESESGLRTDFRLTGNADIRHEIGRTWTARAGYFRGFTFREGYDEPFFTEGATAGIGGLFTRRWSFSAVGTWSLSTLQRTGDPGEDSFTATAQTTYALNTYLALFANYIYYRYQYDDGVPLDPRFARLMDRQGVRVGITTSIPLIR